MSPSGSLRVIQEACETDIMGCPDDTIRTNVRCNVHMIHVDDNYISRYSLGHVRKGKVVEYRTNGSSEGQIPSKERPTSGCVTRLSKFGLDFL